MRMLHAVLAWLGCLVAVHCQEGPESENQAGIANLATQANMLGGDASFIEQFCVNYGAMSLIDDMYFTARNANPFLANLFGAGLAPMLDSTIGSIGPLGRVYLDRSCSPYTRQYNDSLAAYLREGSLANATVAQLLRPWAGLLDAYYNAAQRDVARTETLFGSATLPPRFSGSADAGNNGGGDLGSAFFGGRSGSSGGIEAMQLESVLGNAAGAAWNGLGTGAQGGGSSSQGGRTGEGDAERNAALSEAIMSAMGSMSDLTLSGEELQEVQERAAESPIIVGFVGLLGDVNGAMLSLFENMRSPGGKDR